MIFGKKDTLVGLDIGSKTLKAAEISESKRGRELKRFGMTEIPHGAIEDGTINDPESVADSIRQLFKPQLKEILLTVRKMDTQRRNFKGVIISELDKPGRDPRPEFKTAEFKAGVEKISDLKPGMILEGVVSNVANFGAFVDVGVHQDGLVHISAITNKFISDPRDNIDHSIDEFIDI